MISIQKILLKESPSISDLIACFEQVREDGNVAVIKLDGQRDPSHYTVFITFPVEMSREMIRSDKGSLREALVSVLKKYVEL